MKLTDAIKAKINRMTYYDLLRRWRFSRVGDPIFQGESGKYYSDRMARLKRRDPGVAIAISKRIGWDRT